MIPEDIIAKWLLEEGYFPEQYVVPPSFKVNKFDLKDLPYYSVDTTGAQPKFDPEKSELLNLSFPKTNLTDRTFGIIAPKIYHDIVWYLMNEWDLIIKTLFQRNNKIYSYSFPIPITKNSEGSLGDLRAGRMIYEFLEMAENDLVAEAYNYKYVLKTDIKNFYPSIYTHSIAWAIHTKAIIRKKGNRTDYTNFLGLKLDRLFQSANDGCTNGIAIGPAITDLIGEIILSTVDTECSKIIDSKGIDFLAVRFKDDYRFLCQSKEDANFIIKTLQKQMSLFNLTLNESKSQIDELPEGLFREWTAEYQPFSLRYKKKISYKRFESSFRGTLKVDKKYPGTGVVDRFLSELYLKNKDLKFNFKDKDLLKAVSLLLMLKERRNKSFPQILGIIEKIINANSGKIRRINKINLIIENLLNEKMKNIEDNQYDLIWLIYFVKSLNLFTITYPAKINSTLIKSLKNNKSELLKPLPIDIKLFEPIKGAGRNIQLLDHLALFKKVEE
ncbi:Reverse transcriptase (RNA-dependent DNA polymerase) [Paenimyroides ummariense]|uniref:Reverse transcriptase (RNA-dependent DNA polymerase) n=1 Tax=Paenimyroides ummariense TaxID=913024 RepID=A0A1I4X439_9FLAO|nr:RNA-directed DNA polymerase [Paenimyroides ummariense]SFN20791.1 Reverse transcriptase (RNA-dependent DNA polymerase) [Paenimyroides ummariense]